jgi:16S rRNA (cytosine967-C5)-methyltransferase
MDAMDSPRVAEATIAIYAEARRDWRYTSDVIAREFRRRRELQSAARREVAERVYGLVRMQRRLDAVLAWLLRPSGRTVTDLGTAAADRLRYLLYRTTIEGVAVGEIAAELARAGIAPERVADSDKALRADLGLELSYPDWLCALMVSELGPEEARTLLAALNQRAALCVRANVVKLTRAELKERLAAEGVESVPLALAPDGLKLTTHRNVFALGAFREGLFEVQDEASQLVALLCAPPPRALVVDACAGAGGKTLALAALLGGRGRILALDPDERKLQELRRRARRAGLGNVEARPVPTDPKALLGLLEVRAARVLCDVPCSGLGVLRRNPEARWRLTPAEMATFPPRQLALIEAYAPLVAPGGRLIYATCTFVRAECEQVVEAFLARHPEFVVMAAKEILGAARAAELGDGTFLRTFPHRQGTDGFFAAVLRRRDAG